MRKFSTIKIPKLDGTFIEKKIPCRKLMYELRKESLQNRTKAELWVEQEFYQHFNKSEFEGEFVHYFRRFDFYFYKMRVAVEVDGGYHNNKEQKEYDISVDRYLMKNYKITVLRIKNFDQANLEKAIEDIKKMKQIGICKPQKPRLMTRKEKLARRRNNKASNKSNKARKKATFYKPRPFVPAVILRKAPVLKQNTQDSD